MKGVTALFLLVVLVFAFIAVYTTLFGGLKANRPQTRSTASPNVTVYSALTGNFQVHPLTPVPVAPKFNCFKNRFSGTVLIIVYNYALYSSIPLLTTLYGDAFPTIMFCGPNISEKYRVEGTVAEKGYFFYVCMEQAMKRYPGFSGYLLIGDDLLLNYWQLARLDTNKLWEGPRLPINTPEDANWHWWKTPWGRKQCELALNETSQRRNKITESWDVQEFAKILTANGNGIHHCHRGRSDIFYVPQRFALAFQTMSSTFFKHQVFVEITVPTIFRMLDFARNFESLQGIYIPYPNAKQFWKLYNKSLTFMHPFKLNGDANSAKLNTAELKTRVLEHSRALTKCQS